jgi:hypothetical protein
MEDGSAGPGGGGGVEGGGVGFGGGDPGRLQQQQVRLWHPHTITFFLFFLSFLSSDRK